MQHVYAMHAVFRFASSTACIYACIADLYASCMYINNNTIVSLSCTCFIVLRDSDPFQMRSSPLGLLYTHASVASSLFFLA